MTATASSPLPPVSTDPATDYARGVVDGHILAGPFVRMACARHLKDLETAEARGLRWSPAHADHAISRAAFVQHSKGEWRGRPLQLDAWQCFVVGVATGWMARDDDGTWRRRFRTVYVEVPKKNGKSTMCGYVGLYGLSCDGEGGAEVYAAATAKQQARLVFGEARSMVRSSPRLREQLVALTHNISHEASGSKFEPISSDENTGDGINPHFAVFDELHRLKNRSLLAVLRQGMGARRQPMLWIITTAGDDRPGTPYDEEHNYARKIVEGALVDDTYFAYIACPDEDDDPLAESTWAKANPGFGVSVKRADLAAMAAQARNSDSAMAEFKRFRLNTRSSDLAAPIRMSTWAKNSRGPIDEARLHGRRCRTAIDLSAKTDLTALIHLFPPIEADPRWTILCRFWTPAEGIHDRTDRDRVPYRRWIDRGLIAATEGNRVDYHAVRGRLEADAKLFNVDDATFDPWNAGTIEADCQAAGIRVIEFPQNTKHYAHATKEFLGMVQDAAFDHGGHEVLAWMASNLRLVFDHNHNPMPSKKNSTGRIDGVAGAIMALGRELGPAEPDQAKQLEQFLRENGGIPAIG